MGSYKTEANGGLIYPPPLPPISTRKGKNANRNKDLRSHRGFELGTCRTGRHALTDCANQEEGYIFSTYHIFKITKIHFRHSSKQSFKNAPNNDAVYSSRDVE